MNRNKDEPPPVVLTWKEIGAAWLICGAVVTIRLSLAMWFGF